LSTVGAREIGSRIFAEETETMSVDTKAALPRPTVENIIGARGPNPEHADALMLFGQFVGSWDVDARQILPDGRERELHGEWHFFWVLEGRAIQDVIMTPGRAERDASKWAMGDYQTAIRFYRPSDGTWDVTAISPPFNQVHRLVARKVGDRIVLEGKRPDGTPQRWSFNDITPNSVRWLGEVSRDDGKNWIVEEELRLSRRA
jgi:hypothetical protein